MRIRRIKTNRIARIQNEIAPSIVNGVFLYVAILKTCLWDRVPKYSVTNQNNLQDVDQIKGLYLF